MILVTVFKDEEKWSMDLRRNSNKFGATSGSRDAWDKAREVTSNVDYTQQVNVADSFFKTMSGKPKGDKNIREDVYAVGQSLAPGRRFSAKLV